MTIHLGFSCLPPANTTNTTLHVSICKNFYFLAKNKCAWGTSSLTYHISQTKQLSSLTQVVYTDHTKPFFSCTSTLTSEYLPGMHREFISLVKWQSFIVVQAFISGHTDSCQRARKIEFLHVHFRRISEEMVAQTRCLFPHCLQHSCLSFSQLCY